MAARFERDLSLHLSVQKKLQLFDRSEEQMEGVWVTENFIWILDHIYRFLPIASLVFCGAAVRRCFPPLPPY